MPKAEQIFSYGELTDADLIVGAVYQSGGNELSGEPVSRLLPCGNMGGFRTIGSWAEPQAVVLFTTHEEEAWPDALDSERGTFHYFGDNRNPGRALKEPKGNQLLERVFDRLHADPARRDLIPPFLVFGKAEGHPARSVRFLGLAVPGGVGTGTGRDLEIVQSNGADNYRALFTLLGDQVLSREWLKGVTSGDFAGTHVPEAWKSWREKGKYRRTMDTDTVLANQREFDRLHPSGVERSGELERWFGELVGAADRTRHYATTVLSPSQQLKNKLGQAGSVGDNSLVLLSLTPAGYDRGVEALVRSWREQGWDARPACVAFVRKTDGGWRIEDMVVSRSNPLASNIQRLVFPEARFHEAEGFPFGPGTGFSVRMNRGEGGSESVGSPEELARRLYAPTWWVEEVLALIEQAKAVVFYGPPGSGKTFMAREFARYLQPDDDLRTLIQLHPSYGYEQFFEGYRPKEHEGGLNLAKVDGPLRRLVRRMDQDRAVLILDEMNRGNLPKVFGELYYLLEYRNEGTELLYSSAGVDGHPETFQLPAELLFLGTMNTADRSVSLVDQALRRRFKFVGLFPDQPPLAPDDRGHRGVLREFLAASSGPSWLPGALDLANFLLGDRDAAIGPAYFLKSRNMTETDVDLIWRYSILPTIEDRLVGTGRSTSEFALSKLRGTAKQTEPSGD